MLLLELNDIALSLSDDRQVHYQQPGVALARGGELLFGDDALAASRLHPLDSNDSYLQKLSAEPLPRPLEPARNYADLVYRHLEQLAPHAGDEALAISVSSTTAAEQLAVLLGIAGEARLKVRSFVNRAVLYATTVAPEGEVTVVDIERHRLVLTTLDCGDQVSYRSHDSISGAGALGILDSWTNLVADQFIRATRFDPLHSADSEQQLHNTMEHWRRHGDRQQRDLTIDISLQGDTRSASVATSALLAKTSARLSAVDQHLNGHPRLILTPTAAAFPGIFEHFTQHHDVLIASFDDRASALRRHSKALATDRVQLKTSLPRLAKAAPAASQGHATAPGAAPASEPAADAAPPAAPAAVEAITATHLLCRGSARPLPDAFVNLPLRLAGGGRIEVMEGVPIYTADGTRVLAALTQLPCGLAFLIDGERYELIAVQDG